MAASPTTSTARLIMGSPPLGMAGGSTTSLRERMRSHLRGVDQIGGPASATRRFEAEDDTPSQRLSLCTMFTAGRRWLDRLTRRGSTDGPRGANPIRAPETGDPIETALRVLDQSDHFLIVSRIAHGRSFEEMAHELCESSPDMVRMAYNRALKRLRDEVRRRVSRRSNRDRFSTTGKPMAPKGGTRG